MKIETKAWLSLLIMIVFVIAIQVMIGNEGSFVIVGLCLSSIAFGWYSAKGEKPNKKSFKKKKGVKK